MDKCNFCGARWNLGDNQWISVKYILPQDSKSVIATDGNDVGEYHFIKGNFETDEGYYLQATHWMPLPQPPKE